MRNVLAQFATRCGTTLSVITMSAVGCVLGLVAAPRSSSACSCAEPGWQLELESVSPAAAAESHAAYWPTTASVETPNQRVSIRASHEEISIWVTAVMVQP